MIKNKKGLLVVFAFLVITMAYSLLKPLLMVLTGYAAKDACSCHYLAEQDKTTILKENLDFSPVDLAWVEWDEVEQSASASLFGLAEQKAIFRGDLGCQLDFPTSHLQKQNIESNQSEWNLRERKRAEVERAIAVAFDSIDGQWSGTRAVLVMEGNTILAERYQEGFDESSPLLGWSMTKSVTSTIAGRLVDDGTIDLDARPSFSTASGANDSITWRSLLNMNSGIDWVEDYSSVSAATAMLYHSPAMFIRAKQKERIHTVGSRWYYSSGTTNLLNGLMEETFPNQEAYRSFVYDSILFKAGLSSMRIETDAEGHFVGSSYGYATARDWACFGLLYLREGEGPNGRVFDSSWVDFIRQPAEGSRGVYGGHFWLNTNHNRSEAAPESMYMARGYKGQRVFIFPSMDLVIVRLGTIDHGDAFDNELIRRVLEALAN